jgi:hypothetical protein
MKSTITSLLVLITVASSAQIKKGSIFLGGDLGFSGGSTKPVENMPVTESKSTGFNISPLVGKAIKDNLIAGVGLYYSSNTLKQTAPNAVNKSTTNYYGGNVWLRKYYDLSKSFYLFLNTSLNVNISDQKTDYNPGPNLSKAKGFGINANIYPGVAYQMRKRFFLEASLNNLVSLNYGRTKYERKDELGNNSSYISKNYGFSSSIANGTNPLQIGVRWIIPGKG